MKHALRIAAIALVASAPLVAGQTKDPNQVLADARAALGGDKLAAVKTVAATGRALRTGPGGNTVESELEMTLELPDKYLMRTAMVAMGSMSIYRNSGFNGGQVIEEIDRPPNLAGGNIIIRVAGPGGVGMDPEKMTPEQKAEADRMRLAANKKEYARLMLGMFAGPLPAYPMEFTYAGQAESADGKADVIEVKGEGDFAARLFIDAATHLPLMLSWMDKEPIVLQAGPGGTTMSGGAGGPRVVQRVEMGGPRSKEDIEKMQKDLDALRKEAEAKRRTVEYRLYYGDYQAVGGVTLPHRIQRSIDGKPSDELLFDEVKVNAKVDAKKFQPTK